MKKLQLKHLCPSALLLSGWRTAIPFVLVSLLTLTTACSNDDNGDTNNEPMLKGKISSYNEFGAVMLDFTETDMAKAGFQLGDVISITIGDKEIIMPYYDGFYTRNGEYLCVAYPYLSQYLLHGQQHRSAQRTYRTRGA